MSELLRTGAGHLDSVTSVAFSPDGRRIVTGSFDKTLKVWDTGTATEILTLSGHDRAVFGVAFHPRDGSQIASASWDRTVKIWDSTSGQVIHTLNAHTDKVICVAFSPDGRYVVSGGDDRRVILWDATTGQECLRFRGHSDWATSVAFSPDGTRIASGQVSRGPGKRDMYFDEPNNKTRVWNAQTGATVLTLEGHTDTVASVAFNQDGTRLLTGGFDEFMIMWDTTSGNMVQKIKDAASIISVAFIDSQRIINGGWADWQAKGWSSARQTHVLDGHLGPIYSVAVSPVNPINPIVVTGSRDSTFKIWSVM